MHTPIIRSAFCPFSILTISTFTSSIYSTLSLYSPSRTTLLPPSPQHLHTCSPLPQLHFPLPLSLFLHSWTLWQIQCTLYHCDISSAIETGYGGKRSASVSYLQPQSIRNACSAPPDLVRNTWPIPPPDIMRNAYPAPPPDFMRNAYAAPPLLHLMRNAQLASPSHPQSSKIQYLLHHSHMCNTFLILSLLLHKFDGNLTI